MNTWPYTDFHDLNLDWILKQITELREEWEEFKAQYPPTTAETPEDITEPVEVELSPAD